MKEIKELVIALCVIYLLLYVIYLVVRPPTKEESLQRCLEEDVERIICEEYIKYTHRYVY
jgi:hypothetical protein